jgi:uncharacterized membrane protein YfcA
MGAWVLIMITGMLAGFVNSLAGGGSFLTFPALVYAGLPPIAANASSTVALLPGAGVGAYGYKEYRQPFLGVSWRIMIILTLLGGSIGAVLLLVSSTSAFDVLVPWLLLISSITFAFGKQAGNQLRKKIIIGPGLVLSGQFFLGIYAGYFGGAVGIMMMALWHIFGLTDLKVINANKTYFVFIANIVAVVFFVIARKVFWPQTLVMMVTTVIGSYLGTNYGKKLDPVKLRLAIVFFNFIITAIFFYRTYY